jgi:hypothetical protein
MAVLTLSACERASQPKDARDAFVGDYTFTSTGSVDIFAGKLKVYTIPMSETGELSIAKDSVPNRVMMVAGNDTSYGRVSDNYLFLDSLKAVETYGEIEMNLSFTYGKATLSHDTLSLPSYVIISASYQSMTLSGSGQVDVMAVKK